MCISQYLDHSERMSFEQDNGHNTPFKLSLFSLPNQKPEPVGRLTPPLRTLASVPFLWEEAPGKPRSPADRITSPKAARNLDLPPRLTKITNTPSPTTVLGSPYKLSRAMSFSISRGALRSFPSVEGLLDGEKRRFRSQRWGSFAETNRELRGVIDFSYSIRDGSRSEVDIPKGKIKKLKKRSTFFGSYKFHTWASIYQSVKHAIHRRRN